MGQLMSPNHMPIVGLLETIPATALVSDWTQHANGKLEPEYAGGSTVHWDDQTPGVYTKQIAVDEDGGQWLLSACTFIDTSVDALEDDDS